MCIIDFVDDVIHINEWAGLNVFLLIQACNHDISETVSQIDIIVGRLLAHGLYMCTIGFVCDVLHINEWAGLNVILIDSSLTTTISFIRCMMLAHEP